MTEKSAAKFSLSHPRKIVLTSSLFTLTSYLSICLTSSLFTLTYFPLPHDLAKNKKMPSGA